MHHAKVINATILTFKRVLIICLILFRPKVGLKLHSFACLSLTLMLSLSMMTNVQARDRYPQPVTSCPAGYIADNLTALDYQNLDIRTGGLIDTSFAENVYGTKETADIAGIFQEEFPSGIIPESYIRIETEISLTQGSQASGSYIYESSVNTPYFFALQNFKEWYGERTFAYKFINQFTDQPQELSNFKITVLDIDTAVLYGDQIKIVGINSAGQTVMPTATYIGDELTQTQPFRQISDYYRCDMFDEECQVTVEFNEPVIQVDVSHGSYLNSGLNPISQGIGIHFDGYCYKPIPRLTVKKELDDYRILADDQFTVQVKDNLSDDIVTSELQNITTTGTSNTVTNGTGTTGTFAVSPTKAYTLTEAAAGTTDLTKYTATYECKNRDGNTINNIDPTNLTLTFGDNWVCSIINVQRKFIISGIVFDDNGGIQIANKEDISDTYMENTNYFNGRYDTSLESGIPFAAGHTITLAKCDEDTSTAAFTPQTVAIHSDGTFKFEVTRRQLGANDTLCLTQNEPVNYLYAVDTTPNLITLKIDSENIYEYPNNNFGDVIQQNAALVLIKQQFIKQCDAMPSPLSSIESNDNLDPTLAFSKKAPSAKVDPGLCIAYKITAINRGNVPLSDIVTTDELQARQDKSSLYLDSPPSIGPNSEGFALLPDNGANGIIKTEPFYLNKHKSTSIFFNTKYEKLE